MRHWGYEFVLEQSESGWWSASVPSLPVIHCTGNTKAETEEIVRMAIELEVEDSKKQGREYLSLDYSDS
jgi:predicted RNase H-like HicB family nuclease